MHIYTLPEHIEKYSSPTLAQVCSLAFVAQRTCAVTNKRQLVTIDMSATMNANKSQTSRHAELVCSLINYFIQCVREAALSASRSKT
jgi:hypothetical protein